MTQARISQRPVRSAAVRKKTPAPDDPEAFDAADTFVVARPPWLQAHRRATGWTLVWAGGLALLLSLLPLPDDLRPIGALRSSPKQALRETFETVHALQALQYEDPLELEDDATLPDSVPEATVTLLPELDLTTGNAPPTATVQDALAGLDTADAARAKLLEKIGARVGARHVSLVQGCRAEVVDGECPEPSLEPFFRALDEAPARRPRPVRVIHLGDSLIVSDHITDVIRERLQHRHGDGGRGFLFVDRMVRGAGRTVRVGDATPGWDIERLTDPRGPWKQIGFTGVSYSTQSGTERTSYAVGSANRVDLFFLRQPGGGSLEVAVDDRVLTQVSTRGSSVEPGFIEVPLTSGGSRVTLSTSGGPVRMYGVALEDPTPGVVYDSVGLPGATSEVMLRAGEPLFRAQLTRRAPAMVVVMLGGNEAFEYSRHRITLDEAKAQLDAFVQRVRAAVPDAACMMIGPMDAGVRSMGGGIKPRAGTPEVAALVLEVAMSRGCAYWDMLSAMGGVGAVPRWLRARLMNSDLVHPLGRGGDLLGHLLDVALERARLSRAAALAHAPPAPEPAPEPMPAPEPLPAQPRAPRLERPEPPGAPRAFPSQGRLPPKRRRAVRRDPATAEPPLAALPLRPGLQNPTALRRTFKKLRALELFHEQRVSIVQLGASHTAAHFFTDEARERLAARFGGAGRGYVAAGSASHRLLRSGTRRWLSGPWNVFDALELPARPGLVWGLTGVRAESAPGAELTLSFCEGCPPWGEPSRIELYYLEAPGMGRLEVWLDGKPATVLPEPGTLLTEPQVRVRTFDAPGPTHRIAVRNLGPGPASVFGASHELRQGGVVYDALGLPGASAMTLARYHQPALATQLRRRAPDLYVLFYGTNEAALPPTQLAEMRAAYDTIFRTFDEASPGAECLFISPTDRMSRAHAGWRETRSQRLVMDALREEAASRGCAFWSAHDAMGGTGSIARWLEHAPPLAHPDHVHLTPRGYARLANAFADDFLAAYQRYLNAEP